MVISPFKKLIFVVLLLLQGCFGGSNYAPIIERKERAQSVPKHHYVKPGETLYSIAWRYNMDVKGLASANNISPPYLIYPRQKVHLHSVIPKANKSRGKPVRTSRKVPKKNKKQPATSNKPISIPTIGEKTVQKGSSSTSISWKWPAKGKLGRTFSAAGSVHKGIDIKGKLGEPVYAAGGGKVVYAGSGLIGYGKLLIIKHNENYLSAYGHNRVLLAKEGEFVKGGQRIAEIGDTGTDEVKLHFEIRHSGKPVDPLTLLPRGRLSN